MGGRDPRGFCKVMTMCSFPVRMFLFLKFCSYLIYGFSIDFALSITFDYVFIKSKDALAVITLPVASSVSLIN